MSSNSDTIVARATAEGASGIAITRVSGALSRSICQSIFPKLKIVNRQASFCQWREDGVLVDQCIVIFFPGPASATGEDVLEIHTHGNPLLSEKIIDKATSFGARLAEPGEFTKRAFFNGKIDLLQAEATADLINAASMAALKSAAQSLSGSFSKEVKNIQEHLTNIRVQVEALIDFSDENIEPDEMAYINEKTHDLQALIQKLLAKAKVGSRIREGLTIAIVGEPNVGKSSLLNALTQEDTAIVTNIEGTTRDLLKERIIIDGLMLTIIDTAGIRDTADIIEQAGVEKSKQVIEKANHVLVVIDSTLADSAQRADEFVQQHGIDAATIVFNKSDLSGFKSSQENEISLSAKTGQGIEQLIERLKKVAGCTHIDHGQFIARKRHVTGLEGCQTHVEQADSDILEIRAEELKMAQYELDEILGVISPDDLLGDIFSTFCIGK